MGVLLVRIRDDLEIRFRKAAYNMFGTRKGALSRAIEDAIEHWLNQIESKEEAGSSWEDLKVEIKDKKLLKDILEESKKLNERKISSILKNIGLEEA
ncbi:MAG: hypothetical protein ACP6IS_09785 [Candidatus Asgardarchaeia archaeon]